MYVAYDIFGILINGDVSFFLFCVLISVFDWVFDKFGKFGRFGQFD